jgi:hypothetical protein
LNFILRVDAAQRGSRARRPAQTKKSSAPMHRRWPARLVFRHCSLCEYCYRSRLRILMIAAMTEFSFIGREAGRLSIKELRKNRVKDGKIYRILK